MSSLFSTFFGSPHDLLIINHLNCCNKHIYCVLLLTANKVSFSPHLCFLTCPYAYLQSADAHLYHKKLFNNVHWHNENIISIGSFIILNPPVLGTITKTLLMLLINIENLHNSVPVCINSFPEWIFKSLSTTWCFKNSECKDSYINPSLIIKI